MHHLKKDSATSNGEADKKGIKNNRNPEMESALGIRLHPHNQKKVTMN